MVLGGVVVGSLLGSVADMVDDPSIHDLLEKLGGTTGTVENVYIATEIHFVAVAVAAAGIALVLRLVGSERSGLGPEVVLATPDQPAALVHGTRRPAGRAHDRADGPARCRGRPGRPRGRPERPDRRCVGRRHPGRAAGGVGDDRRHGRPRRRPPPVRAVLVGRAPRDVHGHRDRPADRSCRSWVIDLSPFTHLSPLPGGSFEVVSAVVLTLIAVALMAFGFLAYRRRDVT